jgi:hypothetical protein
VDPLPCVIAVCVAGGTSWTGRPLVTAVPDEQIAAPLGVDFHIGLPASEDPRVANLIPPAEGPPTLGEQTPLQVNAATNPLLYVDITRRRDWRGAEIPVGVQPTRPVS